MPLKTVIAGSFYQDGSLKPIVAGMTRAGGAFRPVLSGFYSGINSSPDPLAGITFTLRLQTHNGNNVPLGLYKDVACTIPATAENDAIAAWRDELGTSGLIATQSDASKRPLLKFVNGVPTVSPDGTNDSLNVAAISLPQPNTLSCGLSRTNNGRLVYGMTTNDSNNFDWTGASDVVNMYSGTLLSRSQTGSAYSVWSARFNGASSLIRLDGVQLGATGNVGAAEASALRLFDGAASTEPLSGNVISVLFSNSTDYALIEGYLETLNP